MKIVGRSIRRPVTVVMLTAAVVIFGLISFNRLGIDLLPDITFPTITIRTEYPGAAPGEVENLITRPIEEAVGIVAGVVRVGSVSRAGLSDVILEFNWGTAMDFAGIEIREKLDSVGLPRDAEKPLLLRFDPSLAPIMRISLHGSEDLAGLRLLAEEEIKRRLESLEGVASIQVSGGIEEEVQVEIEESKLTRLGLPLSQVIDRLSEENINLTSGSLKEAEAEYLVRILNQFVDIEEIGSIVVGEKGEAAIRLKDVGTVIKGGKDRDVITRTGGLESVELAVFKEAGTNTVAVAAGVKERLRELESELEQDSSRVRLTVISDQSEFIRRSIWEVLKTGLWGGLLAVIILYFYLRNLRSTVIISLAIPISVAAAFFLMFLSGVSLNIMSLGGLALGIGMLVDNSIVVLESISRFRLKGENRPDSAQAGAGEVGKAITAATLTTICVFVPVIFVQGVAGQLFLDQALTVTYSLLASLAVALTLIPMLSSLSLRKNVVPEPGPEAEKRSLLIQIPAAPLKLVKMAALGVGRGLSLILSPFYFLFDRAYSLITRVYPRLLAWSLSHKAAVILTGAGVFLASLYLVPQLGSELIPEVAQGELIVDIELAAGTPVADTDLAVMSMQKMVLDRPEVLTTYSIAGASGGFSASAAEKKENIAQLYIALREGSRGAEEKELMEELRSRFRDIPGVEYDFSRPVLFTFKAPVEVQIKGFNLDVLEDMAQRVSGQLAAIPGITDIRSSIEGGNPEIWIEFDRRRMAALGLDVETVANLIRKKVQGEVATEFSARDRKIDVRVRLRKEDRSSLSDLTGLTVSTSSGVSIPLSSVAGIKIERGPGAIHRLDHERVAFVRANLTGTDLGSTVRSIESAVGELPLPVDYSISIGGQRQEMILSFAGLRLALLLAVLLVYLVMAAQFESLLQPLIVMVTIPFGLVGVILILFLTGVSVSVVVLIGVIMMAGIVVNNAIVLVDCINRLKAKGLARTEAILEAGKIRLRPILMTTSTTVLGLLPMALGFGEGAEIRAPMAITVIGGLIISTLLTLVLIPTVYAVLDRRG